jgi:hypothetical protein
MKNNLSTSNLVIILILILILLLVYLKSGKIELFNEPVITSQLTANNIIKDSSLMNFINTYAKKQQQQNIYKTILNDRQIELNSMTNQVLSLINPSQV